MVKKDINLSTGYEDIIKDKILESYKNEILEVKDIYKTPVGRKFKKLIDTMIVDAQNEVMTADPGDALLSARSHLKAVCKIKFYLIDFFENQEI